MTHPKFSRKSVVTELSEKIIVSQTMRYLHTLRPKGVSAWINEEHPGPKNRSHPLRRRGSDIEGIVKPQNGRRMCIEMKTAKVYKFIIEHWEQLKRNRGNQCKDYEHYADQIEYIEIIQDHGGIAMLACSWEQVRDRLISEGLDK